MRYLLIVTVTLLTAGCSTAIISPPKPATAQIVLTPSATLGRIVMPTSSVAMTLPTTSPTLAPVATEPPPAPISTLDQYRLWMEEARTVNPYVESSEAMWGVMMCEKHGDPNSVGSGTYHGLFQYSPFLLRQYSAVNQSQKVRHLQPTIDHWRVQLGSQYQFY